MQTVPPNCAGASSRPASPFHRRGVPDTRRALHRPRRRLWLNFIRWTSKHLRLVMQTRELQLLTAVAAVFPLLVLLDFFSFVLQVASEIHRWPRFGDPDPKIIGAGLWRIRIGLGLVTFPFVSLAALVLARLAKPFSRDFPSLTVTGVTLVSAGLLGAVIRFDPGGFWNLFFD